MIPQGPLTVASPQRNPRLEQRGGRWYLSAHLRRVPWARHAQAIVLEAEHDGVVMLLCLNGVIPNRLGMNLANEPRDDVVVTDHLIPAECIAPRPASLRSLERDGALMRAMQISGALGRILAMTLQYSAQRVQFGRAIAKFQAVQHQVAALATQAAAAAAATQAAVNSAEERLAEFEILAAKFRASEAAGVCCRIAHQVHGAMGFTHEHTLHTLTRRLMSWRDEFGSEAECAEWIGTQVQRLGGAQLWSYISTPQLHA